MSHWYDFELLADGDWCAPRWMTSFRYRSCFTLHYCVHNPILLHAPKLATVVQNSGHAMVETDVLVDYQPPVAPNLDESQSIYGITTYFTE